MPDLPEGIPEEYHLEGIEVLHHSEYMLRLIRDGRLQLRRGAQTFTYHDPANWDAGAVFTTSRAR